MTDVRNETLPVLPLNHGVVLPHMNATIPIESEEAKAALEAARNADLRVLLVPKLEGRYAGVGTVAKIEDTGQMPDGTPAAVVEGRVRARFSDVTADPVSGGLVASVTVITDPTSYDDEIRELMSQYRAVTESILEIRGVPQIAQVLRAIENPGHLADMSGYSPDFSRERKVELLETVDVKERLRKVVEWQRGVLGELSLKDQLRQEVSERMDKQQKDFLLRQQMEAIKKQLGETGDVGTEYRRRLEESGMPEGPRKEAERELDRLERTSEQNPEYGWIRNYLDWMLDLPWSSRSEDNFDLVKARQILDEDHYGLDDVKDRIIEFLAVRKRRSDRGSAPVGGRGSGAIITLVGPPGVGKTSLGESIARALGRKFARVSLGGIHDEAEIRGHRRTYVGALPGRIVRAIKEAGTMNPVIMLDEIDKVGADWRGDPSSALLEVLDPAQNHSFRDHYLEVDLDLSDVLFIPTANVADTIPGPLLDRMELVRLDGYTEEEKLHIASRHLLPRQLERNGVDAAEVSVTDPAIAKVISEFTREAGVRQLERELGRLLRKTVTEVDSGKLTPPVEIGEERVREFLGKARFHFEVAERTAVPGVATGLAVTGTGGDVLFIEATEMTGEKGGLTLTGQLGDVMKESAQIALSYVRSHAGELGLANTNFDGKHVHVHVPAGAVPKDGPSAGVTMTTALVSLFTGRPVRSTVGMTGEVTLQGRVLPIGGVKQKVLAAKRAGLKEVILPARNEPDLDDLPQAVRDEMKIHLASEVSEVLALALEPASPSVAVAV